MKSTLLALVLLSAAPAAAFAEIKIHARVEAVDQFGDPITTIPVGTNFELRAYVDDVRTSTPRARSRASAYWPSRLGISARILGAASTSTQRRGWSRRSG